ncbi:unannotated protein [freshwater metagenome]|uniref:Unannotated protein n=1 Tax=freshwater metagenome TaxID=449393 RepID=A0A6J7GRJ9_9ZZZZ
MLGLTRVLVLSNILFVFDGFDHGNGLVDRVNLKGVVNHRVGIGIRNF